MIGFLGFEAGPSVHIVDRPALSDPMLARMPSLPNWRIGHFHRDIPTGYLETLAGSHNVIQNKELALYYDKLHYIIAGPLWDMQRLIEIWKFNTGAYDYLLANYVQKTDNPGSPPMATMLPLTYTAHQAITPYIYDISQDKCSNGWRVHRGALQP